MENKINMALSSLYLLKTPERGDNKKIIKGTGIYLQMNQTFLLPSHNIANDHQINISNKSIRQQYSTQKSLQRKQLRDFRRKAPQQHLQALTCEVKL